MLLLPSVSYVYADVLQSVVGLRDLGQFRRQPFKDSTGSVIFVAVRHVTDAKNVNKNVYVRWTPMNKLQPCLSLGLAYDSDTSAFDIVAAAVRVYTSTTHLKTHIRHTVL